MFSNYLRAYLRNLWKNRTFSFLNIIGLAVGIACSTLIFLWVEDEFTFDQQFDKKKYLYQVMENQTYGGNTYTFAATPGPLAPGIKADMPGVAATSHFTWTNAALFSLDDKPLYQQGSYADPAFLSMFSFHFLEGNPATALNQVHSLIITSRMAKAFFGTSDPLGRTLQMNHADQYTVTGVIEDLPRNTSFYFSWLAPYQAYYEKNQWVQSWGTNGIQAFVELTPSANPASINSLLTNYIQSKSPGAIAKPFLFPMCQWRLYSNFENGKQDAANGRIKYVHIFSLIAWIVLIIACINFMNLATASSEKRAREVGVRKVLGAGKSKLVTQFIGESLLMALLAVILSIGLTALALPAFNTLVEKHLTLNLLSPTHIIGLLAIGLISGILAGSYPSFYLSSFNPVFVLKGLKVNTTGGAVYIRQGPVILQFAASIVFIISTIIIYQQLKYVQNRELGYNKEGLVYMQLQGKMGDHFTAIRNDLIHTGFVENATLSTSPVHNLYSNTGDFVWPGKDPKKQVLITVENVSPQYISTMGMTLQTGRDFHEIAAQDSTNVIINEALARLIGKGTALGSLINRDGEKQQFRVVGIVHDFIYNNTYQDPAPLILFCDPANTGILSIRLKANADIQKALAATEQVTKANNPGYPFDYQFENVQFEQQFKTETLTGRLSGVFASLAIFISCLGLFGLAAFAAERRTKEIGIRKVLGASVTLLTSLLSKDFLLLVLLSCIIAFPIAWWIMHDWLNSYAYRTGIHWEIFALAGVGALAIALLTVSIVTIRAAVVNPIRSLRSE